MIMASKSWQDVFTEQARATADATGRSVNEVADEFWESMTDRFEAAGLDIDEALNDERWAQEHEPLSIMIDRLVKERENQEQAELANRSLTNEEFIEQEERIVAAAEEPVAQTLGGVAESLIASGDLPMQTSAVQSQEVPQLEVPVTLAEPESRTAMSQRLGQTLTQKEYEDRRAEELAEQYTEAITIDGRAASDFFEERVDPDKEELFKRTTEAADRLRAKREARMKALSAPGAGMAPQQGGVTDIPDELPESPSEQASSAETRSYVESLLEIPAVRQEVQRKINEEIDKKTGGMLGVAARPLAAITGAVGGTGPLLARAAEVGVLQPALAAVATTARFVGADDLAEEQERIWYENERKVATGKHWMHERSLKDANTDAMYESWAANDKLIESRLKDKQFWKSARADFADNIAGLGHLVATFMPTSLDVLRELEQKDMQEEGALASFRGAFQGGMKLPAGMAGAILSMLADPVGALQAQPISAAMTLFPIFKLLKAAKVKGSAAMLDKLDDIAQRAGIDLNDPNFKALTISEKLANRLINEARRGARTRWGKVVESKFAEKVLTQDYIKDVKAATEASAVPGEAMPRLPGVEVRPGITRTAKAGAATYLLSQEDPEDTLIALLAVGGGSGLLHGLNKWEKTKVPMARMKASVGRFAANIAMMADPDLTLKVEGLVDRILEGRNLLESDFKTVQQAMGSSGGRLILEQLVPDLGEIAATRSALLGVVEAMPDVKRAKTVYEDAAVVYEDMKAKNLDEAELRTYVDDVLLPARAEYRSLRVRRFAENIEGTNLRLPSEETGALVSLNRLMENQVDLRTKLNERLAAVDKAEVEALNKIDDKTNAEALAKLENELTKRELERVGVRVKNLATNQTQHLDALRKLEEAVRKESGAEYAAAVAEYEARVKAAADKFDKRVASGRPNEVGKTKFETELLDETRQAEVALLDDLQAIAEAKANDIGALDGARQALLDNIQRKRFAAAARTGRGVKGLRQEGSARVSTVVESRRQTRATVKRRFTNERRRLNRQHKLDQDTNSRSIAEQQRIIEMHNTRAMESTYLGNVPDEGTHVYQLDAPVRFDVSRVGQEGANRFDYLDAEGQPTNRYYDTGEVQEGAPSGLFPDDSTAKPARLQDAYDLEAAENLSQAEATSALRAITRIAENLSEHDLGFAGVVNAFDTVVPGSRGGKNLAKRIYTQILSNILFSERHAALLRSPDLRNQFTRWLNENLGDALAMPGDAVMSPGIRKKIEVGVGKLVNDFAFGRTKGAKYLEVNPVFELADGRNVGMKSLFDDYMDSLGKKQESTVKRARTEALDSFRQQMIARVEEGIAARWFWKQVGSSGWFDAGISPRYLADIADYFGREGHIPPILKTAPEQIQSMLRVVDEDGVARQSKAVSDLAERLMQRDGNLTMETAVKQANDLLEQVKMRLSRTDPEGTEAFVPMKSDVLPSLQDTGAPHQAVLDQGAGIVRWKAPMRVEDMAGWVQMMGKLEDAYINNEIGGATNSTLSWLFMANKVMAQSGFLAGMRQVSSAMKRNLTTQRPQTALTNYMSNYLAMMTREGLLPQQAALEIFNTANMWRRYAKDPSSLTPLESSRIKGLFDRGITSNNAVTVDANIVMDSYSNNFLGKAVDLYANGLRKTPLVGDTMRGFDWAYQAGDGIFKLNDSMRALQRLDGYTNNLSRGNSITFMDVSRRNKVMGKVTREMNGDLVVEYKGKRHTGKAAEKALEDIKLDTSAGYANGLYFDYSRVPGFIELARNFDAILFGPFKTWAWKSLDIPGFKRGMGTRAIFGDTMIKSTDGHVMAQVYTKRSMEGMRRAALLGLTRATTRDDEYLRLLTPEWIAPTAFFDDNRMTFQSMGNRNFAINMSNILDAAWKLTRPEQENILMRKLRPKEKTSTEELAKLVLGDGLVVGTLMNAVAGRDDRGQVIPSWQEWLQYFGQKATPGWIYAGGDSVSTLLDGMRGLSGIRKANRWRDDKTRMSIGSYLLKVWTGRRMENIDPNESLRVLLHLSGYTLAGLKKGTPKFQRLKMGSDTLNKYYNNQWKQDVRNWQSEHPGADKDLLADYKTTRRNYWNGERDKLQGTFLELAKDLRTALINQRKAADQFKELMRKSKIGRQKDLEQLEGALDMEQDIALDVELPIPGQQQ